MKIETKYNIGDKVWFLDNNNAYQGYVSQIRVSVVNETNIVYTVRIKNSSGSWTLERVENRLFPTKEELLKSL